MLKLWEVEAKYTLFIRLAKEDYIEALNIEFNMEYPNGYKHNKHEKLINEILKSK